MSIFSSVRILLLVLAAALIAPTARAGAMYRPGQEQRTVSASTFQISVQKNGRIDVSLLNGERMFINAFPAILFEGETEWTELDIASRYTFRERVNDVLGQGQAIIMAKDNCEWAIRTFSTQPFFTVQTVFINTSKKPVRVVAASPWSTGDTRKPGGVWLGENTSKTRALIFDEQPPGFVHSTLVQGVPLESRWHMALHNAESGRSLIAGFLGLTDDTSVFTLDRLAEGEENAPIELFRAMTTFETPIEVEPGARLEFPVVYFSVSDNDPLIGLRRFGQALARDNGIRIEPSANAFIGGGAASDVDALLEMGWRAGEERDTAQESAQFFRGERGASAQLSPKAASSWDDVVQTLTGAVRLFHLTPYFWNADAGTARLDIGTLTESQRLAWISGLAFTGGVMDVELSPDSAHARTLQRFTPALDRPAQPIDLFRNDRPRVWSLPMDDSGGHVIAALFNWDTDALTTVELNYAELGLARDAYYTVYDVLPRRYLGTAADQLRVEIPPGSVRIVSLRRHVDAPTVLAFGDHVTTTSSPDDAAKWDGTTNTLSGTTTANWGEPVRIDVWVPERFDATASLSDNVRVEWPSNDRVVKVYVAGERHVATEWRVSFR